MVTVPTIDLNNGVAIPQLGFGVFQVPPAETQQAVEAALEAGYRHIDTAAAYRNESGVGAAIKSSGIAREDLFITTKLRNGEQADARRAFDNSLRELGLDFVDLYLIHWPVPSQNLYVQAWRALEEIYTEGLSRAIGVSNFLAEHLENLLAAGGTVPAVNQIEIHPTFQQRDVAESSRRHGIAVEAYSPLGQGADLESRTVTSIAAKYLATPAQVVLAWHLANGNIVIPKSANPDRMAKNLAAARLTLDAEDLAAITALDAGGRVGADPATADFTQL
ncbi:aldo/keto reductase [Arthrobacter sulfonylureivorans]|uniref:Aldo/keto reductase n=1 Tax=Arthrobacter sulfonylureivorans TaxID=2486855 RepID=A0ABY3WCW7_9MICC|nr:aldo/keto reductase [Arthrobacter sulfonylureivorans]UNK46231.1 aldo/keto reductase [Arthrobacter sulfonylureivorans]